MRLLLTDRSKESLEASSFVGASSSPRAPEGAKVTSGPLLTPFDGEEEEEEEELALAKLVGATAAEEGVEEEAEETWPMYWGFDAFLLLTLAATGGTAEMAAEVAPGRGLAEAAVGEADTG